VQTFGDLVNFNPHVHVLAADGVFRADGVFVELPPIPEALLDGGFVAFLYTQHLQQSRLFKELFTEFNQRYNELNEGLNDIRGRPEGAPLKPEDTKTLFDYFNLCGEEFLFFRAGYIDLDVWRSWCHGMQEFMNDPEIRRLWEDELKSGSYYGFTLDEPVRV